MSQPEKTAEGPLYGLLLLMVFFWSSNLVVGKIALREFPPLMVAGLRTLFAGGFIWPLYFLRANKRTPTEQWTGADVPWLIVSGVLGVVLNQLLFVVGLSMTSVAHAAIIVAIVPLLVLLIAAAIGQERITKQKLTGMIIAALGVTLLQLAPRQGNGPSVTGDCFILGSATAFALFTVLGKRLTTRHGSLTVNTFAYVGGALFLLPLVGWEAAHHAVANVSAAGWASVAYMALFPSVISYLIYSHALKHLAASRVSAFSYLQPLIATGLAAAFLSEMPGPGFLTGGALVLSGVYVTERG